MKKKTKHCPRCFREYDENYTVCDSSFCAFSLGLQTKVVEHTVDGLTSYVYKVPQGLTSHQVVLKDKIVRIGLIPNNEEYYRLKSLPLSTK